MNALSFVVFSIVVGGIAVAAIIRSSGRPAYNVTADAETAIPSHRLTTSNHLDGYEVVRSLGVVRGLTVRSRNIFGNWFAGMQQIVGGDLTMYIELCEHARSRAFSLLTSHAAALAPGEKVGIIAMRMDSTDLGYGIAEVMAYGTAVVVRPLKKPDAAAEEGA